MHTLENLSAEVFEVMELGAIVIGLLQILRLLFQS